MGYTKLSRVIEKEYPITAFEKEEGKMNKTKKSVPDQSVFKDPDKEARFWENHFDEAVANGKSTTVSFAKNLSETVNIRLDPTTLNMVRTEAKSKGLGPTQLIRMWIMEKIGNKHAQVGKI